MIGYCLLEQRTMMPYKKDGIEPHPNEIGILDFLRELQAEDFPFQKFYEVQVVGLEEVLYAARPEDKELALRIRQILSRAAQDLQGKMMSVQAVFRKGRLIRGDNLWLDYRDVKLPIDHIFTSPHRQTDDRGNQFFAVSFNLTS